MNPSALLALRVFLFGGRRGGFGGSGENAPGMPLEYKLIANFLHVLLEFIHAIGLNFFRNMGVHITCYLNAPMS
jgi:hypothetical protein